MLKIRDCPHCRQQGLLQNGGFWVCSNCALVITQAALLVEEQAQLVTKGRSGGANQAFERSHVIRGCAVRRQTQI